MSAPATTTEASVRHVLFVDDEAMVLHGLRRMLRGMRATWSMRFCDDPREALQLLSEHPFDALVTDMRMPHMDGAELLAKARELRPGMARIALSGYAEKEVALRSVGLAHQFLAKPCDAQLLKHTVARACALRDMLRQHRVAETVCRLGTLPSLPKVYEALQHEMNGTSASLQRVAQLIEQDLAMAARLLQLVNSSFFGLGRRVNGITEAVNQLGTEVIRSLLLSGVAFSVLECRRTDVLEALWEHSSLTALLAARIVELERGDEAMKATALQAGLLHDVGQLVLLSKLPEEYRQTHPPAGTPSESVAASEQRLIGCDHGPIGAYLMGLWGLGDELVEALAYHHAPAQCPARGFSPLMAVHAANALVHERTDPGAACAELDERRLAELGLSKRIGAWRSEADRLVEGHGSAR